MLDNLTMNINNHLLENDTLENYKLSDEDISEIKDIDYKNATVIEGEYTKILLYLNEVFEIFLIVWDNNVKTKLHAHPKKGCIMYLIDGCLIEDRVTDTHTLCTRIDPGHNGYIEDKIGKHSITSKKVSYSVHIYAPPHFYSK